MDRVVNPFPLLLMDNTLRSGDIVFPDGPRVFTGSPGRSHSVSDFEKLATTGKKVPQSIREGLTKIKAGVNEGWAKAALRRDGKLKDHAVNPYAERGGSFAEVLRIERSAQGISGTMRHDDVRILSRGREREPSSITLLGDWL
jgi:hypothetical protein